MSENTKKYCPFLDKPCIENKCMLYIDKVNKQIVGTSTTKKVLSIYGWKESALEEAGLNATDPSEIWFILDSDRIRTDDLECTGYYIDTGEYFSYTYDGQWNEKYFLLDVHTRQVVASKDFWSTPPECGFSSCILNTVLNTADCTGGEGHSTYNEATLIQWLKDNVK